MESLTTIHPEFLRFGRQELLAIIPVVALLIGAIAALFFGLLRDAWGRLLSSLVGLASCAVAAASALQGLQKPALVLFNQGLFVDGFTAFFWVLFSLVAIVTLVISTHYLKREALPSGEFVSLLLFSVSGMMLLAAANDLVVLFLSLEMMSIAVYVMVGYRRSDRKSNEAAIKYFILGAVASAVLLYGIALLYGATGTTTISKVIDSVRSSGSSALLALGTVLVVIGFLFKVASVPFHAWMPDVYEGAPVPVTGFMATALKAAAFAAFARFLFASGFGTGISLSVQRSFHDILWVCAVLTMVIGNLVALMQTNLKRMLAYSSIAHTGYLLMGLIAGHGSYGHAPLLVYLTVYALMNLGAFAVLSVLAGPADSRVSLQDISGLASRSPWLSVAFAVFMFSLAGVPLTGGFVGKYLLFYSAVQAGEVPLVVIAVLCSVVSVYYYLRVLVYMFMRPALAEGENPNVCSWSMGVIMVLAVLVLQAGILPAALLQAARQAVMGS